MKINLSYEKTKKNVMLVRILIVLLIATLIGAYFVYQRYLEQQYGSTQPTIQLLGPSQIRIDEGEEYEELGVEAYDGRGHDISKNVTIEGEVDPEEEGTYLLYYSVVDRYGNESRRLLRMVIVGDIAFDENRQPKRTADEDLKNIIRMEIEKHQDALTQFDEEDESDCAKVDYLIPYIHKHFPDGNYPDRTILRPTIRDLLNEDDEDYLSATDVEALNNIVEEVIVAHEETIADFEGDSCSLLDYLEEYVYEYYDERNQPTANAVRSTIEKKLGG